MFLDANATRTKPVGVFGCSGLLGLSCVVIYGRKPKDEASLVFAVAILG